MPPNRDKTDDPTALDINVLLPFSPVSSSPFSRPGDEVDCSFPSNSGETVWRTAGLRLDLRIPRSAEGLGVWLHSAVDEWPRNGANFGA